MGQDRTEDCCLADVKFDESHFPAFGHDQSPTQTQLSDVFSDILATMPVETITSSENVTNPTEDTHRTTEAVDTEPQLIEQSTVDLPQVTVEPEIITQVRRSNRSTAPPERYGFMTRDNPTDDNDNPTYEVAMQGPDKDLWRKAMDDEFEAFTQQNVGTLVNKPTECGYSQERETNITGSSNTKHGG